MHAMRVPLVYFSSQTPQPLNHSSYLLLDCSVHSLGLYGEFQCGFKLHGAQEDLHVLCAWAIQEAWAHQRKETESLFHAKSSEQE